MGDEDAEGRTWAAEDLYRGTVMRAAFRLALGDERFASIEEELTIGRPDTSYDGVARMRADARWWSDSAGYWTDAAQRALA